MFYFRYRTLATLTVVGSLGLIAMLLNYNNRNKGNWAFEQPLLSQKQAQEIIEKTYQDLSGFSVDAQDRQLVEAGGGNPTYGEITIESVAKLIEDLKLNKNDLFFDLGSGVGKICVQIALTSPARTIGVELSPTRHKMAQQAKDKLLENGVLKDTNKLIFKEENITSTNLRDASVILLCSTCFSEELMRTMTDIMQKLKPGLRVLTLKQLPEPNNFELIKTYDLPTSWSSSSPLYLYTLK